MEDLSGRGFGRWTVLEFARKNNTGMPYWRCRCECGTEREVLGAQLRTGGSRSCGCLQRFHLEPKSKRHGMWKHPTYRVWVQMKSRCSDANNPGFADYGGRGITICQRWGDFALFWKDMGSSWQQGLYLDRINNDKGYHPSNCRWTTMAEQARNTRRNRYIQTPWGRMIVADAARKAGIDKRNVHWRIRAGWPEDRLLEPPMGTWERRDKGMLRCRG